MKRMKNTIKKCVTSLEDFIHFCLVTQETFENNNNKKNKHGIFAYVHVYPHNNNETYDERPCVVFFSHHLYYLTISLFNYINQQWTKSTFVNDLKSKTHFKTIIIVMTQSSPG